MNDKKAKCKACGEPLEQCARCKKWFGKRAIEAAFVRNYQVWVCTACTDALGLGIPPRE